MVSEKVEDSDQAQEDLPILFTKCKLLLPISLLLSFLPTLKAVSYLGFLIMQWKHL